MKLNFSKVDLTNFVKHVRILIIPPKNVLREEYLIKEFRKVNRFFWKGVDERD